MATTLTLNVNGVNRTVTIPGSSMPLLWVLRDYLGLTGSKYSEMPPVTGSARCSCYCGTSLSKGLD